jgi:hypothetical protein
MTRSPPEFFGCPLLAVLAIYASENSASNLLGEVEVPAPRSHRREQNFGRRSSFAWQHLRSVAMLRPGKVEKIALHERQNVAEVAAGILFTVN